MKTLNRATITLPVLLAFVLTSAHLPAATITVTTTADSGSGSLRAALATAANGDTIDVSGVSGTILLTTGELLVSNSLTLLGPGPAKLSVDGNGSNRVFRVGPSNTVTISSLTVTNALCTFGFTPGNYGGGGILNDHSTLTMSNCVISGNAGMFAPGGGILNDGQSGSATLSLTACTLISNWVFGAYGAGIVNRGYDGVATLVVSDCVLVGNISDSGGAIDNDGEAGGSAVATVISSTISNNTLDYVFGAGGGIINFATSDGSATLAMRHCILSGNSAGIGGGIYNYNRGSAGTASVQVIDSTVSSNSADFFDGGGIYNANSQIYSFGSQGSASVRLVNSILSGNHADAGGGIFNDGSEGPTSAEILSSTVSGNSADFGGGIYSSGALTLGNSTVSGNSAYQGGGLDNYGTNGSQIVNSTLSDNSAVLGGGIYIGPGTLALGNTLLNAGASGGTISNDLGSVNSLGFNLSSDSGGGVLTNATDQTNTAPLLGPLQDNGGPTFTHALLCGSPAIDKGKNLGGLATDQRGLPRTFDNPLLSNAAGGDGTDIGAFERQEICLESPCAGVGILVAMVENSSLPDSRKHPLLVSLDGACQSFEKGHLNTGVNQLQAFEQKVRAQVEKSDPALARRLVAITELILGAIGGG
jgi:hypothetical protein